VLGAADVGANHQRDRIWIVARNMANPCLSGFPSRYDTAFNSQKHPLEKQFRRSGYELGASKHWWEAEPNVGRVVDGLAARVDRLKAIGNGQVPLCAATAFRILSKDL
jgi:DNA (cytosine-5)-methyltransferase 1